MKRFAVAWEGGHQLQPALSINDNEDVLCLNEHARAFGLLDLFGKVSTCPGLDACSRSGGPAETRPDQTIP